MVSLVFALLFAIAGARAIESGLTPERLGVFVAPPPGLIGAVVAIFALFLCLVGVSELVRYLKPAVEVVMDDSGVSTFGLLGRRRIAWADVSDVTLQQGVLNVHGAPVRGGRRPVLRIAATRLDVPPAMLVAHLQRRRPDLTMPWDWSLEAPNPQD